MTVLSELTEQLMAEIDYLKHKFNEGVKPTASRDFFQFVKGDTDDLFDMLKEWEEHAIQFTEANETTVYPQQIYATTENMKALILHSYYLDARKRAYMELYKSCHYVLGQMLKETKK